MSTSSTTSTATSPTSGRPPAIEVDNLSSSYRVHVRTGSALSGLTDLLRRGQVGDRLVPALRDVSFAVDRGTVLGVIGRNGAGKSTLLRCLAGILAPEEGRITVRGRISTLLSIGVGMNPSLTGRENIKLGGLAQGLPDGRLEEITEEIAEFAQLGEYVNYPLKTYSSGMHARLGFAVAAFLDPEILLIDEALAGGDSKFKDKTADKMYDMCGDGRTIVLVSHGLVAIQSMATNALWLHQGKVVEYGDPDHVVASYMRYCRLESLTYDMDD